MPRNKFGAKKTEVDGIVFDSRSKYAAVLTKESLVELYENQQLTLKEIGDRFDCNGQTVLNYMRKHGIQTRPKKPRNPKSGSCHPLWSGGRQKHSDGYIYIFAPEHPNAHKNVVLEHRLVMEKHLGRYLANNEVVHHINGDKGDNSIENLQLMTRGEHTNHHRPQISPCLGIKHSEETRKKVSRAKKEWWLKRKNTVING